MTFPKSGSCILLLAILVNLAITGGVRGQSKRRSDVPMTRPEEMLAIHHTRYFHSSTFVELNGGRVLHVSGTEFSTSDDAGITWSKSYQCKDTNGDPVGGVETSLVRLNGNGIGLAARRKDPKAGSPFEIVRSNHMVFWRSDDGGKTWQPPIRITPQGVTTASYQDTFLRTSSGRIILPVFHYLGQDNGLGDRVPPFSGVLLKNQWVSTSAHYYDSRFSAVYLVYSDDDGRTWNRNQDGELIILTDDWSDHYSKVNESSVAEVAPGRLLIMMRNALGRLFQSWSNDNGATWTRPQPTSLASSTAPPQLRKLPTGHLLVVWNQESEEEILRGQNRMRISSAISRNGGSIWEFFQNVESFLEGTRMEPGPIRPVRPAEFYYNAGQPAPERQGKHIESVEIHGRCSYPSVFVMKDRVLIANTYSTFEEDATTAQLKLTSKMSGGYNQNLRVLPLKWFYGGKVPAENPYLKERYEPAKP